MKVLLLNAGSSSLKCTLLESTNRSVVARASVEQLGSRGHGDATHRMLADLGATSPPVDAVGHRIVHGGAFRSPVRVTPDVRSQIAALSDLAPLHNPPGLDTLDTAMRLLPSVPHVAVFDTSFHATLPRAAHTYPVPERWTTEWGIRRYGFHGLSHAYCARRAAEMLGRTPVGLRLVICHLGAGCSASAVRDGRSIDTTMGFTPLDGLMMATRSGSVDPGILTYVQTRRGLSAHEVDDALNHASGLLGVSGLAADMREVLAAAAAGNARARLAIDMYAYGVRKAIGAFAATLGGIDALVFTAGVGENAAPVRAQVCEGLEFLGVELDRDANAACRPDRDVARAGARARILVIATREDLSMLSGVLDVVAEGRTMS